ncbi:hypothetical protein KIPB_015315, partial [Kipferlia bialata]|eukprot:g15315.t1
MPLLQSHPGLTSVSFTPLDPLGGEPVVVGETVQVSIAECGDTVVNVELEPFSCGNDPRLLQGVVSDALTGAPISGVVVLFGTSVLATTDQSGLYQVTGLPYGFPISLRFSSPSPYISQDIDVSLGLCGVTQLNVFIDSECLDPVLQGVVTDAVTARGVPSVTVWVEGVAATSTNQDGTYELSGLSFGTPYTVRFSPSSEHEPASAFSVYVDECGATRLDMTLTPICDDPVLEGRVTFEGVGW